ncbi:polysaccharide pyruvyl transferase family protein [Flavobacterium psychrotrophum]|uniref:polysaccharide pyruvyl transferase family protein n=1 Tax=Flavobacterium psychrotrophum TaxID=2294119 RepID=UPI000E31ED5F|nr:polysaccharide pyruvyl transferase family protein [Flavobacterium psychrotrophum]
MKIGTLTLPLHTNYGGNLQAFALMKVLKDMGHEPVLINRRQNEMPGWKLPIVIVKRSIKKYLLGKKGTTIFLESKAKKEFPIISQFTQPFIDKYITPQTEPFYSSQELLNGIEKYNFDAVIVGSDQVWRVPYAPNIEDNFFGFLRGDKTKRISYAASFGTSDWEFSEEQTQNCKKLLQHFDAVSVREQDGVVLSKTKFNVDATHVLDPTMLLTSEDYMKIVGKRTESREGKDLLVYVLDNTQDKDVVIAEISKKYSYNPFRVNTKTEQIDNTGVGLNDLIAPPTEDWLAGFNDAKFVVTDSFHACAFSILFNKPFVVYGNKSRGLARFTSLLAMFGLEDRLIYESGQVTSILAKEIDWNKVNLILEEKREFSRNFLISALK